MKTSRRGFLGIVGAFVAAAAARDVMPSGSLRAKPITEQIDLMAILKECRVQSFYEDIRVDSYRRIRVLYRHAPNEPLTSLDADADRLRAGLLPIGAIAEEQCDMIDVTYLGDPTRFEVARPVKTLEVVFA